MKYLGIILDNLLSWKPHLEALSTKLRKANGIISKLRHVIPKAVLLQLYYSFFDSHLRYACQVWGQDTKCLRIFKLQKQCMRLITFSRFNSPSSSLFSELKVLKFSDSIKLLNISLLHEVLSNSTPSALTNTYNIKKYPDLHNTRGNKLGLLTRPQCNTTKFGLNSIIYQSIVQWNELQLLYPGTDLTTYSKAKLSELYKSIILSSY